jgi:short subunit fatty acids transporter
MSVALILLTASVIAFGLGLVIDALLGRIK